MPINQIKEDLSADEETAQLDNSTYQVDESLSSRMADTLIRSSKIKLYGVVAVLVVV